MQHTHGDSSSTCCNGRVFFLVCVVHGWTRAWQESILQQWQMQPIYFNSPGLIKSVVKPHWLTGITNSGRQHCSAGPQAAKPTFCQNLNYLEERRYTSIFSWLLKTKKKYWLEKMKAIFIVSDFWIPLSKFTSSNSHKKLEWDWVNGRLLEKDFSKGLVFLGSNTVFSYSTFWERREKGYCAFHVPWTLCHSFCLNYATGLHFVAILGF